MVTAGGAAAAREGLVGGLEVNTGLATHVTQPISALSLSSGRPMPVSPLRFSLHHFEQSVWTSSRPRSASELGRCIWFLLQSDVSSASTLFPIWCSLIELWPMLKCN